MVLDVRKVLHDVLDLRSSALDVREHYVSFVSARSSITSVDVE